MTAAFFAISGLDMLNCIDVLDKDRDKIISWIYSLQVLPNADGSNLHQCGFRGSPALKVDEVTQIKDNGITKTKSSISQYDSGHIAMTYTALLTLLILRDDLSDVNPKGIMAGVRHLQKDDGSFCSTSEGSENDMRFVYCAACICYILEDWSGMDRDLTLKYIMSSLTYEGAFAQGPGLEAHGGSTFCAVASLMLMGCLHTAMSPQQLKRLQRWCILRQESGFQGRPNKPIDTCYSFWVGATLQLLDILHLSDPDTNHYYLLDTQDPITGGFAKWPDSTPDPLHAYFGICGLSLLGEPHLKPMHPSLNVSIPAADYLEQLQQAWSACKTSGKRSKASTTFADYDTGTGTCHIELLTDETGEGRHDLKVAKADDIHSCLGIPQFEIGRPLLKDKHVQFFQNCLGKLHKQCQGADSSRLTVVCFGISALDLLDNLDTVNKKSISEWIYCLQVTRRQPDNDHMLAGFSGSPCVKETSKDLDPSHLAMTYFAVCTLLILNDDFSRIRRSEIIETLKHLQNEDGSFRPSLSSTQSDIKFLYWAVGISYILNDWRAINISKAIRYIKRCKTYEGGFGQGPGSEAHGGATFCAVASLWLMGCLRDSLTSHDLDNLCRWCLCRQEEGFAGRTGKDQDISYTFWGIATLQLLGKYKSLDAVKARCFVKCYQDNKLGGFTLKQTDTPDYLMSYFGVACLALLREPGIDLLHPAVNVSYKTLQYLRHVHHMWKTKAC